MATSTDDYTKRGRVIYYASPLPVDGLREAAAIVESDGLTVRIVSLSTNAEVRFGATGVAVAVAHAILDLA